MTTPSSPTQEERCETCRFRSASPYINPDRGSAEFPDIMFACKRRSPVATGGLHCPTMTIWPMVTRNDWCGEWRPNIKEDRMTTDKATDVTVTKAEENARGLRTSQKALDAIARQEQANIAGYLALRDFPIGSALSGDAGEGRAPRNGAHPMNRKHGIGAVTSGSNQWAPGGR